MSHPNLYICSALVMFGILFHFVLKLGELEASGQVVSPWEYWRKHPYTSLTVVMAAYLTLSLQHTIGELGYSSSVLIGISCNSLADKLRARGAAYAERVATGKVKA